jgi:hypothetical protein
MVQSMMVTVRSIKMVMVLSRQEPATLVGDAKYHAMPDGQMFYSITYGKNAMGSYASQITDRQRWMIIHYIKAQQVAKSGLNKAGSK